MRPSVGSATFTIVASRLTMRKPKEAANRVVRARDGAATTGWITVLTAPGSAVRRAEATDEGAPDRATLAVGDDGGRTVGDVAGRSPRAHEMGAFLRSRRTRLTPGEVGLPDGGVRRTPGLRREEVARLAGVSEGYYIRLEQGRAPHPSASVLGALARTLRLSADERGHLFALAA